MSAQQTFCIIKPDGMKHNLEILNFITNQGLKITKIKQIALSIEHINKLYAEHASKPFFPEIQEFMRSGEVIIMILEGEGAVAKFRQIMGATKPVEAEPDTIRGQWGDKSSNMLNCTHGSDSTESATREIALFADIF